MHRSGSVYFATARRKRRRDRPESGSAGYFWARFAAFFRAGFFLAGRGSGGLDSSVRITASSLWRALDSLKASLRKFSCVDTPDDCTALVAKSEFPRLCVKQPSAGFHLRGVGWNNLIAACLPWFSVASGQQQNHQDRASYSHGAGA